MPPFPFLAPSRPFTLWIDPIETVRIGPTEFKTEALVECIVIHRPPEAGSLVGEHVCSEFRDNSLAMNFWQADGAAHTGGVYWPAERRDRWTREQLDRWTWEQRRAHS